MNEKILREWIQVLRTTDKEQGQFGLKQNLRFLSGSDELHAYCCLGILCEDVLKLKSEKIQDSCSYSFDGQKDYLPKSLVTQLELTSLSIKPVDVEPAWTVYITLSQKSYLRGMEESEDFASGVEKIDRVNNANSFSSLIGEKLKNGFLSFKADHLNDKYNLTFKEIAAFLEYADRVE